MDPVGTEGFRYSSHACRKVARSQIVTGRKGEKLNTQVSTQSLTLVRWFAVLAVAIFAFRLAWFSDDAMITLRTALNITHGWGPGFNATESVQAYTHPLWFLLWTLVGVISNQWVYGILALSILMSSIAVGILVWRTKSIARIIAVVGLLVFSNAFMEYSTSGLENPLAYLGVAVAFALGLTLANDSHFPWWARPFLIGITFSAILLTRFDLVFLVAPAMLILLIDFRRNMRIVMVAVLSFVIPLVGWFTWSWITYQSLLPNTFMAKTNVDIPQTELIVQGLRYFYVTFENDPITLILLVLGIGAGFAFGDRLVKAWTVGIVLYLGYVIYIGGDFMAGRFMAVPALLSALILAVVVVRTESTRDPIVAPAVSLVFLSFLLVGTSSAGISLSALTNPQEARWEFEQNTNAAVADERGFYVSNGLSIGNVIDNLSLAYINPDIAALGDGSGLSRTMREVSKAAQNWPYNDGGFTLPSEVGVFCGGLGYLGMATGPITHIVDSCALTDRFLAAQTFSPVEPFAWRMGHFARYVPEGYLEAIQTGDPLKLRDTAQAFELGQLWEKIR